MYRHQDRQQRSRPLGRPLVGWVVYAGMLLLALASLRAQGSGVAQVLDHIRQASLLLLGLALAAEVLRFGCMGLLLWALAALLGVRTPLLDAQRLTLVAVTARHLVPFGGLSDYALRTSFLQRRGMRASTIAAYLLLDSLLSSLALITIFALGLISYLALYHRLPPQPTLFIGAAIGSLGVLALLGWLWHDRRAAEQVIGWLRSLAQRAPPWLRRRSRGDPDQMLRFVERLRSSLHSVQAAHARGRVFALALAPLLADVVALAAVFAAIGLPLSPAMMLLGYGLAGYLAFLTPLPGDAGVVEAALTLVFSGLGYDLALVVVGVLLFRLLSFWLPIPFGLLLWWGHNPEEGW
jgi:uncharacterized protein (TIRG00374 family)